MNEIKKKIGKALAKKAVGYSAKEVVEEYQDDDGVMRLTKKRVTKKHVPPDTQAAKMIVDGAFDEADEIENMTDEQLEKERQRLIKTLKEGKDEN